jgi:hypothetical protein
MCRLLLRVDCLGSFERGKRWKFVHSLLVEKLCRLLLHCRESHVSFPSF